MGLKGMFNAGKSANPQDDGSTVPADDVDTGRCLRVLAEESARLLPVIESESYHRFRTKVDAIGPQMRDQMPDPDKLDLIRTLLHALEEYRNGSENALRARTANWRSLVSKLLQELLVSINLSDSSASAAPLVKGIARLTTAEEIESYTKMLDEFLHPQGADQDASLTRFAHTDRSMANDNVAGLLGGGRALERLTDMMDKKVNGYAVLFRLGCLDIIGQRFGNDTVQDCVMAVSAYLIQSLHGDDEVYHWTDCSLLALLQGRPSEQILIAELARILSRNRDITVKIGERNIMVRIPLQFVITPMSQMRSPEELFKISAQQGGLA